MGEEQLAATRVLAENVLGRFASLRASLRERIQEVDLMSQREIIQAADDVNTIYHIAISQIESLKLHLSARLVQQGETENASHDAKISLLDTCVENFNQKIIELKSVASQSVNVTEEMKKTAQDLEKLIFNIEQANMQSTEVSTTNSACPSVDKDDSTHSLVRIYASLSSTSLTIQRLVRTLGHLTPILEREIGNLSNHAQTLSETTFKDISNIAERDLALRKDVASALEKSDLALGTIVKTSQSALSHMQFQDAISQGLRRLDAIAHENEVALCREVGLEDRIASLAPVIHEELGGDKAVEQKNAGKVVLF